MKRIPKISLSIIYNHKFWLKNRKQSWWVIHSPLSRNWPTIFLLITAALYFIIPTSTEHKLVSLCHWFRRFNERRKQRNYGYIARGRRCIRVSDLIQLKIRRCMVLKPGGWLSNFCSTLGNRLFQKNVVTVFHFLQTRKGFFSFAHTDTEISLKGLAGVKLWQTR